MRCWLIVFQCFCFRYIDTSRRLRSLLWFVLKGVIQRLSDRKSPTSPRDVAALHTFLRVCHSSDGDRSARGFLPMLSPVSGRGCRDATRRWFISFIVLKSIRYWVG